MSEDWNAVATDINAALAEVGTIGIIKRKGVKTGPDNKPVYGPEVTHNFNVVLGTFSNKEREGTAILATDIKIMAGVGAVVPAVSDRISVQGLDYQIYGVQPPKPGGIDLMYEIWARA